MEKNQQSLMCEYCQGTGRVTRIHPTLKLSHVCDACKGTGILWVDAEPIERKSFFKWIKSLFD